jgi:hypothetical protein
MGTPTSVTIVWRTTSPSDTRLRYGTELGALDQEVLSPAEVTDHVVTLTGLLPATRYYYEVGSTLQVEAGNDADHFFVTSPEPGTEVDFTAWIVGDSGTGGSNQASVRDAMLAATAGNPPDLFLHVGDIAYSDGTEQQYTEHHFEPYRDILRHTVFWPARGNHDGREGYLNAFVLPAGGEAGGVPSGTEEYYSFDHANTHFVVLDSQGSDREPGSPMLEWLANDLAENTQRWLIAYFHHPPYSKGKHDSDDPGDSGGRLIDMRENAMPILEAAGVDLVLAGHSHTYERSYLIDQVYGFGEAPAFRTPDFDTLLHGGNILDAGDGDPDGDGAYEKSPGLNPHDGTVYVVAGHGGKSVEADGEHPVMIFTEIEFGSALLRIDGDVLTLDNLRADGVVSDRFAIVKGEAPPACTDDAECDDGIACTDDVCNPVRGCLNADACSGVRFCNADTGVCEVETLVSFQNGTDGYAGAQDTYVSASSPDAVNGDKPEIRWDLENPNGSGFSDHALLRFDAIFGSAPGRIPVGATIESAILELVMTNPTELPDGAVYESLVPWSESSTTHGDFGGDAGIQPDELGAFVAAAPVGEEPCPAPCALPIQLDVTSSLQRSSSMSRPACSAGRRIPPRTPAGSSCRAAAIAPRLPRPSTSPSRIGPGSRSASHPRIARWTPTATTACTAMAPRPARRARASRERPSRVTTDWDARWTRATRPQTGASTYRTTHCATTACTAMAPRPARRARASRGRRSRVTTAWRARSTRVTRPRIAASTRRTTGCAMTACTATAPRPATRRSTASPARSRVATRPATRPRTSAERSKSRWRRSRPVRRRPRMS